MTGQPGRWGDVAVGSYVRDKHGKVWRIDAEDRTGRITITDRDGNSDWMLRPPFDAPVTIMTPSLEEATTTVATRLGGTIIHQE